VERFRHKNVASDEKIFSNFSSQTVFEALKKPEQKLKLVMFYQHFTPFFVVLI
jgi:hypothetical protein